MLKVLDLLIEVRNNVLYTKNVKAYSNLYKQIELNDDTILTAQVNLKMYYLTFTNTYFFTYIFIIKTTYKN